MYSCDGSDHDHRTRARGTFLETVLLIACVLVYLGYLAVRLSRRLRLPVVTSFLLLGILAGPEGLNLVNTSVMSALRIVEPVALGLITFAAGEQLYIRDVRALSRRSYVVVGLETILPVVLVGVGAWLLTGRLEVALPVGAIAGTTGLATVMSTLKESGAKGNYAKLLGFTMATDNFFAILAFSLVLPLVVGLETGGAIGSLYADRLIGMAASVGIGFVAGIVVSRLVREVRSSHELSMLVLAHVLVVVGITEYLGYSILLAGLAMGATAANLTRAERDRERAFAALISIEFPIIAIFFLWAGASLHFSALGSIGLLFAVYVGARVVGKLAGPMVTALLVRKDQVQSRRFVGLGMSLLPQAGAAVGLGILARTTLPESGETILAAVLAAVVVFELVGPLGVHWAARYVGEAKKTREDQPLTLDEALSELHNRRARVAAVIPPEADPSLLDVPRLLAVRLDADLLVVPVRELSVRGPSLLMEEESNGGDADGSDGPDHSEGGDRREILHETVVVRSRTIGGLASVLAEYAPSIVLLAPRGLPSHVLKASDDLSRRLGCPVLPAPTPAVALEGRQWAAKQLDDALQRSQALWRKAQQRWLGRGPGTGSGRGRIPTPQVVEIEVPEPAQPVAEEEG